MLDHVAIQCADVLASAAFYDAVLAPLGGSRVMDFGEVVGYGDAGRPEFCIGPQHTGTGFRETHLAFTAASREAVRAFFAAATGAGAEVLNEPRLWPEYHASYYGAFVRDPDGNNVEAVCRPWVTAGPDQVNSPVQAHDAHASAGLPAVRVLLDAGDEAGPRDPAEDERAFLPGLRVAHYDYSGQVPGDLDALAAIAAAITARMPIGTGQVRA